MNYSKLAKYETMAHREGMLQRFKETCFWDFCERPSEDGFYTSHQYFYAVLEKSVGKEAKEVFIKLKQYYRYKKHYSFKKEMDKLIKKCNSRVHILSSYYSPWTNSDFYVNLEGLICRIEDHPLYVEIKEKLKVKNEQEVFNRRSYLRVRRVREDLSDEIIIKHNGKFYYSKEKTNLSKYEIYYLSHSKPNMVCCSGFSLLSKKDLEHFELK